MRTVCVLEGNIGERKRQLENIKKSLADPEICNFDNEDFYDFVSQQVTELSCFGRRRLFIIRELPQIRGAGKSKDAKSKARTKVISNFKKLFPLIPVGNLVAFNDVGISAPSFFKEIEKLGKLGGVYRYKQKISKNDAKKIVFSYFKKREIEIEDEVSSLIVDSLNIMGSDVDIDKLLLILLKMYHYVYGKKSVTKKDVFAICSMSEDFIVWSLYKIFDGDGEDNRYSRSFKMVNDFLINSRYFYFESTRLMQSMLWRYGLLLLGKSGVESKISKKDIAAEIANIKKLKSTGKAQKIILSQKDDKPEYSDKMVNNVLQRRYGKETLLCYTLDELLSIYHTISKALVKVRSGCTNSEMTILLQVIFLTICGELGPKISISGVLDHKKMLRAGA